MSNEQIERSKKNVEAIVVYSNLLRETEMLRKEIENGGALNISALKNEILTESKYQPMQSGYSMSEHLNRTFALFFNRMDKICEKEKYGHLSLENICDCFAFLFGEPNNSSETCSQKIIETDKEYIKEKLIYGYNIGNYIKSIVEPHMQLQELNNNKGAEAIYTETVMEYEKEKAKIAVKSKIKKRRKVKIDANNNPIISELYKRKINDERN